MNQHNDAPPLREVEALLALIGAGWQTQATIMADAMTRQYPAYAFGWTILGVLCEQDGNIADALAHMRRAVELSPHNPDVHANLGGLLQRMEQSGEAEACFLRALQIQPGHVESCHNLGLILKASGRLDEAEAHYRQALQSRPDSHELLCNLGTLLMQSGRVAEAEDCYRQALALEPGSARAHYNLGLVCRETGRLAAAEACYREALRRDAGLVEAHANLGVVLVEQGRPEEAVECCTQALRLRPNDAGLYCNLGNALRELGQFDAAESCCRTALNIEPKHAGAHYNLGEILYELGRLHDAADCYRRALELDPAYADAHNNLGVVLQKLGRLDEAEDRFRQALLLRPGFATGYSNLAGMLKDAGRLDEALACDRRAVEIDPHNTALHGNLVYTLYFHPDFDEQAILTEAKRYAAAHPAPQPPIAPSRRGDPARKLRIGYVSPNFREHCQSLFTVPLLSNHDHAQFEIHCYADLARPDAISERLAACADVWRPTRAMDDARLAQTIAADGIDILVDLTMHMAHGRPMLFARKPAPVQLSWLAYPGTTGIPGIDYRLTDPWLDPPGLGDERYMEKSIRLPDTFWCYDPLSRELPADELPALANGYVTFGCLNNFCKVSDATLSRWGRVMARVPASKLLLLADSGAHRRRVLDLLGRHGVAAERVEFVGFQPRAHYLHSYRRIDLCLDTLPYNGHTTSLDALWMGVPVVTEVGRTVVGRAGWSQLNNLGLPELAGFSEGDFIDIASGLAHDPPRLGRLREGLRQRMEQSPLMDGKRFCNAVEDVYRKLGQRLR